LRLPDQIHVRKFVIRVAVRIKIGTELIRTSSSDILGNVELYVDAVYAFNQKRFDIGTIEAKSVIPFENRLAIYTNGRKSVKELKDEDKGRKEGEPAHFKSPRDDPFDCADPLDESFIDGIIGIRDELSGEESSVDITRNRDRKVQNAACRSRKLPDPVERHRTGTV
jgi:hypothetical protein